MGIKLKTYESKANLPTSIVPSIRTKKGPEYKALAGLGEAIFERGVKYQQEQDILSANEALNQFYDEERIFVTREKTEKTGSLARGSHNRGQKFYDQAFEKYTQPLSKGATDLFRMKYQTSRNSGLDKLATHEALWHQKGKIEWLTTMETNIEKKINSGTYDSNDLERDVEDYFQELQILFPGMDHTTEMANFRKNAVMKLLEHKAVFNPEEIPVLLRQYNKDMGAGDVKRISDVAREVLRRAAVNQAVIDLQAQYGKNYSAMILDVTDPKNWPTRSLDAESSQQVAQYISWLRSDYEHKVNWQEQQRNRQIKRNDLQAWVDFFENNLTMQQLINRADQEEISQGTLTGIRNWSVTMAEHIQDDPQAIVDIVNTLYNNGDVEQRLLYYVNHGQIKKSTFRTMYKEYRSREFKIGMDYLKEALQPSLLERWNVDKNVKYAEAVSHYMDEYRRNDDKRVRAIDIAKDVVGRYTKGMTRTFSGLPSPKYMPKGGSKRNLTSLNVAEKETIEAYGDGKISEEVFEEEINIITKLKEMTIEYNRMLLEQQQEGNQ